MSAKAENSETVRRGGGRRRRRFEAPSPDATLSHLEKTFFTVSLFYTAAIYQQKVTTF
jgi:hypothetical protein